MAEREYRRLATPRADEVAMPRPEAGGQTPAQDRIKATSATGTATDRPLPNRDHDVDLLS